MNYGWTILIWVAIGLYVLVFRWIINQKEREEIKRNKNSVAPKFFPW